MEIVKRGEIPDEKIIQLTCGTCGTIFKFKQKEATYSGGINDWCYTIDCPVCNRCCSFGGPKISNTGSWYDR